jgi:flagellar hook-associated protein 2
MTGENSISSVVASLSGGAGIDIRKLAEDLTNVERLPLEERLNRSIDQESAQISAYSVLKYNVEELISKFEELDDSSELLSSKASSSDTSKVEISSVTGAAIAGAHAIAVSSLATQQINISNTYNSAEQSLNGGSGFDITFTASDDSVTTVSISDGNDTPGGIVAAINSSSASVSASLLAVDAASSQFRIVLSGDTGSANSFVVNSSLSDADLGFHDASNGNSALEGGVYSQQLASNAAFTLNGVSLERASNNVSDALDGVVLELKGVHSSGSSQIKVDKSQAGLKIKLQELVESYNATRYALSEVSNRDSTDETVGGALVNDYAAIRQVRNVLYEAITQDSSAPSGSISALRDIGVELKSDGDLKFDEIKFDAVMATSAADVGTMLSAGTDNQSRFDTQPQGLARDVMGDLEEALTDSIDGLFATRTISSTRALAAYEDELEELDGRMTTLFDRYITQFTVMETLVSQLNATRESLSETWKNMGKFGNN